MFKVGQTFHSTCIFTGGNHSHKIVERNGNTIKTEAIYEEMDGTHRVEEEWEIRTDEFGEYIVLWEYQGEQGRKYATDLEED